MSLLLRDYQQEALAEIQKALESGTTRQLIVLPTGSGKTIVASAIAKHYSKRLLFIAHREELITQTYEKMKLYWPEADIGICKAERNEIDHKIVIGSVQTCAQDKRLTQLKSNNFQILIIDEAHHAAAKSYKKIINELGFSGNNNKLLIGLTATPMRTKSNEGLGDIFQTIVFSRSVSTMIKAGYLAPVIGRRITTGIDIRGIKIHKGDFEVAGLSRVVNKTERNELIVKKYQQHAPSRKGIAFCADVKHAHDLAQVFNNQNIAAAPIWGAMDSKNRRATLEDFKHGRLQVLTSVGVLTEGFDETSVSTILMCRPTKSLTLFTQCIGRGLRLHPAKENCLIMDFADNYHNINTPITLKQSIPDAIEIDEEKTKTDESTQNIKTINSCNLVEICDEEIDLLGQRQFIWIALGDDEYSLADDDKNEIIIKPHNDGYVANLYHYNKIVESVQANPLPLDYCQGVAEDYARKKLKTFYANTQGKWLQDSRKMPATRGQQEFLAKNGIECKNMSKMIASIEIRRVIALQNKEQRNETINGSITPAQRIILTKSGIPYNTMNRGQAERVISILKKIDDAIGLGITK